MNATLPKIIGKIYILPLSKEDESFIRRATNVVRDDSPYRNYTFRILKKDYLNLTPEDVMMACGYHPAGYGNATNFLEKGDYVSFKCSGSCD